ncbi:MAG: hypothetical protein AABN34_29620 [Acidobacteriota bacterium]
MSQSEQLQLRLEFQENPVADEVSAVTAIVRPILTGILNSLKEQVVKEAGGRDNVKLFMLPRLRRPGDGDIGICFEYAVHEAIKQQNPLISERIRDALIKCNLLGHEMGSILFGAEKNGAVNLIETASEFLTDESVLLYGTKGRPVKLKGHIWSVSAAFRRPVFRQILPQSISGLWKADLFTGNPDTDKWIGTTLKINRTQLEGAKGLRLGIVPASQGESDAIVKDDDKNLVICPLPYDRSFMQAFYQAWEVVVQFLAFDARLPREASLPRPPSRQVARYLEDRRDFPITEVIAALDPLAQPHLLRAKQDEAAVVQTLRFGIETTTALLAPIPRQETP